VTSDVEIKNLNSLDEQSFARYVFDQTWSKDFGTEITSNLLQAMVHNGAYLSGAFVNGKIVAASFGFAAIYPELHLHSHMTAVLPGNQDNEIGYKLKMHQKNWAKENGFSSVTWTFDPLVARNANFNINKLKAEVVDYYPNFYGSMEDELNAGDDSDRLFVKLDTNDKFADQTNKDDVQLIAIPKDIVAIRKNNLNEAREVRQNVRKRFQDLLSTGYKVIGFTNNSEYKLAK
jgi:predicted GNAT superfamily acetyltransferase